MPPCAGSTPQSNLSLHWLHGWGTRNFSSATTHPLPLCRDWREGDWPVAGSRVPRRPFLRARMKVLASSFDLSNWYRDLACDGLVARYPRTKARRITAARSPSAFICLLTRSFSLAIGQPAASSMKAVPPVLKSAQTPRMSLVVCDIWLASCRKRPGRVCLGRGLGVSSFPSWAQIRSSDNPERRELGVLLSLAKDVAKEAVGGRVRNAPHSPDLRRIAAFCGRYTARCVDSLNALGAAQ